MSLIPMYAISLPACLPACLATCRALSSLRALEAWLSRVGGGCNRRLLQRPQGQGRTEGEGENVTCSQFSRVKVHRECVRE